MNPPIVRFAPSPPGRIHIGNARTALLNWVFAKQKGGRFVLRFDDTDVARSKQEYAIGIEQDLKWLGIVPDLIIRQSGRGSLYDHADEQLKASGRLYPAYETADELERRRKRQIARGAPPIYDRAARNLIYQRRPKGPTPIRGKAPALALLARSHNHRLGGSRPRNLSGRLCVPLRPRAGA